MNTLPNKFDILKCDKKKKKTRPLHHANIYFFKHASCENINPRSNYRSSTGRSGGQTSKNKIDGGRLRSIFQVL